MKHIEELIEDYWSRVEAINKTTLKDVDDVIFARLQVKAECYNTFISELGKLKISMRSKKKEEKIEEIEEEIFQIKSKIKQLERKIEQWEIYIRNKI